MADNVIYVVDDGMSVRVADSEVDAYYKVIQGVVEDDPDAFLMIIQDFLSDSEMIRLGKGLDERITDAMVFKYQKI